VGAEHHAFGVHRGIEIAVDVATLALCCRSRPFSGSSRSEG